MWSLSILHVLLLTRYSAPTLTTRQWRNRLKLLGISPHMYTFPFFSNIKCGLCQDAVSPTRPEAAVVQAIRTFLRWFYRHYSSET